MKTLARKQDTRRKIQLGGLIIKAGLSEESNAVLLGLLLEAQDKLQSNQAEKIREQWRLQGDIAFTVTKSTSNP
ncbi:MAG: conjugal transfer protein TraD [Gammaproteobacteria bacterium]